MQPSLEPEEKNAPESDEDVVARVLRGETRAFEILMRRHNQRVFRTLRAILKNDDEAQDAMQEAYVSAYVHLGAFGGRARFSTWLVKIAVHEALARLRRAKRVTWLDETSTEVPVMDTTAGPEQRTSDQELRILLEDAIDALPIGFRTVFVMRTVEDMSSHETADALDIPEETVRTRLHRARGLLRDYLADKVEKSALDAYAFHLRRCDRVVETVLARILRTDA